MRPFLVSLVIVFSGCCGLQQAYVEQDRRDFDTMTPRVKRMIEATDLYDDDQKQDMLDRLTGRDLRITRGEEAFSESD